VIGDVRETRVLDRARGLDSRANRVRTLACARSGHLVERHARDVDVQVDAIEQRSRKFRDVACDGRVVAAAIVRARAAKSARARIHRRQEREARGVRERSGGARDRDRALFDRLAHHFKRAARAFRKFVEGRISG
jgi:hypothetical protein